MADGKREATRQYGKRAALLSIAIASTGLLTYGFFSLASHSLPRQQYGQIVLLWSAVFITTSVLYRPIEQLLSRTIAERQARGFVGWQPLRVAASIQLALGLAFLVLALTLKGTIQDELFSGNGELFWIMVVAVLAYAISYFARGFLAGQHLLGLYGALVFMEAVSRFGFALAVAVGVASGATVTGMGIAAAPLISLFVVPLALGGRARRLAASEGSAGAQAGAEDLSMTHGAGFAAAVLIIMFSEQTFINGGPLIIKATEGASGSALAGFVFNLLLVARAPLQLFQAVATSLLPHLTSIRVSHGRDHFHHSVKMTVLAIAAFAVAVIATMLVAGPELMELFFGSNFDYDRLGLALVAVGMGLYLTAATLNQAALAQGQARHAAICWAVSAALFAGWLFISGSGSIGFRVESAFVASALLLCALLYVVYRRPEGPQQDVPREGSPEEVETFLAAADEAS